MLHYPPPSKRQTFNQEVWQPRIDNWSRISAEAKKIHRKLQRCFFLMRESVKKGRPQRAHRHSSITPECFQLVLISWHIDIPWCTARHINFLRKTYHTLIPPKGSLSLYKSTDIPSLDKIPKFLNLLIPTHLEVSSMA